MRVETFDDGIAILGDCTDSTVIDRARQELPSGLCPLIITDPPYGNILSAHWDKTTKKDVEFAQWMIDWTKAWGTLLETNAAFYVWGGIGKKGFRPFFHYLVNIEDHGFELGNYITWGKKRGYGVQNNYLFTREELAYLVKGNAKKPRTFNVPHLTTVRGYAGYNKDYPAKSEFYRRTNVWTDINEMFRGKVHDAQKPVRLIEVPIEVHTNPGEYVIDMFAGSGTTALAARNRGRKFIVVENDPVSFDILIGRLRNEDGKSADSADDDPVSSVDCNSDSSVDSVPTVIELSL